MKRIMFNDKYGLTQTVLEGRKTMTRRIVKGLNEDSDVSEWGLDEKNAYIEDYNDAEGKQFRPMYQLGEVVAIAQAYKDTSATRDLFKDDAFWQKYKGTKGWSNKMFVRADEMSHHIKITDIKVERLQDISDEDCLREGIMRCNFNKKFTFDGKYAYDTPRKAFAAFINKVSGDGMWENNPYVFCYEFEVVD